MHNWTAYDRADGIRGILRLRLLHRLAVMADKAGISFSDSFLNKVSKNKLEFR